MISSHYMTGCRIHTFGIFTISWLRSVCMNVKIRNKFIEIKYSVSNGLVIFITNYWWFRILEISRYRWSNGNKDLVNINAYAKFHHKIPLSSNPFSHFQNLKLGKASTNDKCHFAIYWAWYLSISMCLQNLTKYPKWFKSYVYVSQTARGFENCPEMDKCDYWAHSVGRLFSGRISSVIFRLYHLYFDRNIRSKESLF